jgi:hypothetical protein
MSNIVDLKIFAGHAITTSDLSADSKNQLLNYVKEASEHQVKAFLLDGEIMNTDDLVCETIIDERYEISEIPEKVTSFISEWKELMS